MAETKPHQRIVALVIAILFFGFTFAASFAVIWQVIQDNRKAKTTDSTSQTADTSTNSSKKLQGTKLADFTPVSSIPDLKSTDLKAGTGQEVKSGDTITAHYTGAVAATGVIFQSSLDSGQPVSFTLKSGPGGVIDGWVQGVPGMKVGGVRRILIPAAMAYGANPPAGAGIPANADLVFDITLQAIGQ